MIELNFGLGEDYKDIETLGNKILTEFQELLEAKHGNRMMATYLVINKVHQEMTFLINKKFEDSRLKDEEKPTYEENKVRGDSR